MVDEERPGGADPHVHRTVREVKAPAVPFAENQKASDAVADQMRRAANGAPLDAGQSSAFMPNTNGERPFVELQLPDGRAVMLAQPEVAIGFIMGRILGPQEASNPISTVYAKTLLYVAAIDGQPVRRPTNMAELQNLANVLGDRAVDLLSSEFMRYWPQVGELPVIKKNL